MKSRVTISDKPHNRFDDFGAGAPSETRADNATNEAVSKSNSALESVTTAQTKPIYLRVSHAAHRRLKVLAADERTTVLALMIEAMDLLAHSRGEPPFS